ncbi:MAG: RDD family protein [Lysobacteraceae bacterium]
MSSNPQDPVNPYAAPQAELVDVTVSSSGELASRWLRLGGAIIDGIIVGIVAFIGLFAFGMGSMFLGQAEPSVGFMVAGFVIGFGAFVLVQGYFLYTSGQTIAKKLLGMRIVDGNGEKPEFFRMLGLRYALFQLLQMIPFIGMFVGLVNALFIFREDRRCLHDLAAGTHVVRV